jgi:two-component system chemotaxis response regulator CheY
VGVKQRILIVDDAAFIRSHLRELAEKAGFEVVAEAEDASGAIEAYRTHRPDAVTMDVVMPGNGIHAIEEIMAIDAAARILVVTAVGQK